MSIRRAPLQDILERCDRLAREGTRLRPGQPQLAAFDADGTLWKADVGELLWERLMAERALDRRAVAPIARALRACGVEPARDPYVDYPRLLELHRAGHCSEELLARVMLEGLAGMREEDLYVHALKAVTGCGELSDSLGGEASNLMDHLRRLGFQILVVSGSPRWVVEVAVQPFGVPPSEVLAGQVAVVNSVLSDGVIEPLPHGKGKIQAILRRYGRVPIVAAGNGLGDLAMLEGASHLRFLFNPTDELVKAADEMRPVTWSLTLPQTGKASVPLPGAAVNGPRRAPRRTARPQS
ncbi:MAG: HAD family hydrolase [Candidatus Polarisedimenticolia bacterium]